MIPKVIHYIWFGGKKTKLVKKCIASWKNQCPDYEIKEWNENNFDINKCLHCKQAYENKKWAFASDYARLDILNSFGGIYMDTDVELLKPLDDFLNNKAFVGFEDGKNVGIGQIFGSVKNHCILKELMNYYEDLEFVDKNGNLILITNTDIITTLLKNKHGLICDNSFQILKDIDFTVYPQDFFQPIVNNKLILTDNTISIHHFSASWLDKDYSERKEYIILYGRKKGLICYALQHPIKSIKKYLKRDKC